MKFTEDFVNIQVSTSNFKVKVKYNNINKVGERSKTRSFKMLQEKGQIYKK